MKEVQRRCPDGHTSVFLVERYLTPDQDRCGLPGCGRQVYTTIEREVSTVNLNSLPVLPECVCSGIQLAAGGCPKKRGKQCVTTTDGRWLDRA